MTILKKGETDIRGGEEGSELGEEELLCWSDYVWRLILTYQPGWCEPCYFYQLSSNNCAVLYIFGFIMELWLQ